MIIGVLLLSDHRCLEAFLPSRSDRCRHRDVYVPQLVALKLLWWAG